MSQAVIAQRARQAYQTAHVEADEPMGLVVKLYDGMLGFLRTGAEALAAQDRARAAESIRRATDIVGELQAVLDLDAGGEVASNLDRLYSYARRRIVEAHAKNEPAGLLEVVRLLTPLRDAWNEAWARQRAGAA